MQDICVKIYLGGIIVLNIYRFNFDSTKARELRRAINDKRKFSIVRNANGSKEKKGPKGVYNAWDRLCATMTRLEDTIEYVNNMELGKLENGQAAFGFYEFINCSYVIIECIKVVVRVYDLDYGVIDQIEKSTEVFGTKYGFGGNDSRFFEYIRSLCGVHPLCTNRQSEYLRGSDFHCCAFVAWTDRGYVSSKHHNGVDLIAHVYATNEQYPIDIGLYINEFEKYLSNWIECIPNVIEGKNKYVENRYELLRKEPVKVLSDFNGDCAKYFEYLKNEYVRRVDESQEYILEEYIDVFKIKLSNENNQSKLGKYKNAILYSLNFLRNSLQTMAFDGFENTGIEYPEKHIETDLYIELASPLIYNGEFSKYSYEIQKVHDLTFNSSRHSFDKYYARRMLEKLKPLINKYVLFTNQESDEEVYVLVKIALYLESLTRKSIINKNIPNETQYRERLLTEAEIEELYQEESVTDGRQIEISKLKEFLEEYGIADFEDS